MAGLEVILQPVHLVQPTGPATGRGIDPVDDAVLVVDHEQLAIRPEGHLQGGQAHGVTLFVFAFGVGIQERFRVPGPVDPAHVRRGHLGGAGGKLDDTAIQPHEH